MAAAAAQLAPMDMASSHDDPTAFTGPVQAKGPAVGEERTVGNETRKWDGTAWRLVSKDTSENPNGSTRTFLGTEDFGGRMKRYAGTLLPTMAETIAQPIAHPLDTVAGLAHSALHPLDTVAGVVKQAKDVVSDDPETSAKAAGSILGMVAAPEIYGGALRGTNAAAEAIATRPAVSKALSYLPGYMAGRALIGGFGPGIIGGGVSRLILPPYLEAAGRAVAGTTGPIMDALGMTRGGPSAIGDALDAILPPGTLTQSERTILKQRGFPDATIDRMNATSQRAAEKEALSGLRATPSAPAPTPAPSPATGSSVTPEELDAIRKGTVKVSPAARQVSTSSPAPASGNLIDAAGRDLGTAQSGPAPRPAGPWDTNTTAAGTRDAATADALVEALTGDKGQTPQLVASHDVAPPSQPRVVAWKPGFGPSAGDARDLRGRLGTKTAASILKTTPDQIQQLAPEMNPRALPSDIRTQIDLKLATLSPSEAQTYLNQAPNALVRAYIARKLGVE